MLETPALRPEKARASIAKVKTGCRTCKYVSDASDAVGDVPSMRAIYSYRSYILTNAFQEAKGKMRRS
jgi:hypothetical protein